MKVVSDVLEDWSASSQGQALQQKAPLACLTEDESSTIAGKIIS